MIRSGPSVRFLLIVLLLCTGCATSWPDYGRHLTRAQILEDKKQTIPVVIAVKPAPEAEFQVEWNVRPTAEWVESEMHESVAKVVGGLRGTGLFRGVVPWEPGERFDILVESRPCPPIRGCGTPFVNRQIALYLLPASSRYGNTYDFRFVSPEGSERLDFQRVYEGRYYGPSILCLPFLSWQRRTTEADLLRHDLAPLRERIQELGLPR